LQMLWDFCAVVNGAVSTGPRRAPVLRVVGQNGPPTRAGVARGGAERAPRRAPVLRVVGQSGSPTRAGVARGGADL